LKKVYNEPKPAEKKKANLDGPDKIVPIAFYQAVVNRLFASLIVQKSSFDVPNKLIKIAAEPLSKPQAQIYNSLITT